MHFYGFAFQVLGYSQRILHFSLVCMFHLCALSPTCLPTEIYFSLDLMDCFLYQGIMAIFAYLSLNVKSCCNQIWWFISVPYIRNLSGSILQELGFAPGWAAWTVVHGFSLHSCSLCHCKSGRVSFVNKSLTFLPKCWRVYSQYLGYVEDLQDISLLYLYFWVCHLPYCPVWGVKN